MVRVGGKLADFTPAVADDGTIYVGCTDNYLYCINPESKIRWKHKIYQQEIRKPYATMALDKGGSVYLGKESGHFKALSPEGKLLWEKRYMKSDGGPEMKGAPVIDAQGNVYLATPTGLVCQNSGGESCGDWMNWVGLLRWIR